MKHIVLSYMLLFLFSFAFSQVNFCDSLGRKQGTWVTSKKNGNIYCQGEYVDGKRDGTYIVYRNNGIRNFKITYKDGVRHGKTIFYYRNGNKKYDQSYINGEYDSLTYIYRRNGDLKIKFIDGNLWQVFLYYKGENVRKHYLELKDSITGKRNKQYCHLLRVYDWSGNLKKEKQIKCKSSKKELVIVKNNP